MREAAVAGAQVILLQVRHGPQAHERGLCNAALCIVHVPSSTQPASTCGPLQELFENVYFCQEQKPVGAQNNDAAPPGQSDQLAPLRASHLFLDLCKQKRYVYSLAHAA